MAFGRKGIHTTVVVVLQGRDLHFCQVFSAEFSALVIPLAFTGRHKSFCSAGAVEFSIPSRRNIRFWKEKMLISRQDAGFHQNFCSVNTDREA